MEPIGDGKVIVIDNGSSFIKVGVAGEEVPRCVVPTVVVKDEKTGKTIIGSAAAKSYVFLSFLQS